MASKAKARPARRKITKRRRLAKVPNNIDRRIDLVTTFAERLADELEHVPDKKVLRDAFPIVERLRPLYDALRRVYE